MNPSRRSLFGIFAAAPVVAVAAARAVAAAPAEPALTAASDGCDAHMCGGGGCNGSCQLTAWGGEHTHGYVLSGPHSHSFAVYGPIVVQRGQL